MTNVLLCNNFFFKLRIKNAEKKIISLFEICLYNKVDQLIAGKVEYHSSYLFVSTRLLVCVPKMTLQLSVRQKRSNNGRMIEGLEIAAIVQVPHFAVRFVQLISVGVGIVQMLLNELPLFGQTHFITILNVKCKACMIFACECVAVSPTFFKSFRLIK